MRYAVLKNHSVAGSEVWVRRFPKNGVVQFRIRQQALQTRVLAFQFLKPLRPVGLQPAIFPPPAIVRLHRHTDLLARMLKRLVLGNQNLSLTQLVNDLLNRITPSALGNSSSIKTEILTQQVDQFEAERST